MLPESLVGPLRVQLEHAKKLWALDRRNNVEGVELPGALERKYPRAVRPSRRCNYDDLYPRAKGSRARGKEPIRFYELVLHRRQKPLPSSFASAAK